VAEQAAPRTQAAGSNADWFERARRVIPAGGLAGPLLRPVGGAVHGRSGEGAFVVDAEGTRYVRHGAVLGAVFARAMPTPS